MKRILLTMPFLLIALNLFSQDSLEKKPNGFSLHGYADLYYQHAIQPAGKENPTFINNFKVNGALRQNLALMQLDYSTEKWKAAISLMNGDYSRYNLSSEPGFLRHVYEASLTCYLNKKWSIQAGIFPSHIGYETAISSSNWNLGRSLVAENSPYYETGLKLNYTSQNNWSFDLLFLNGWQHIKDNNREPALGTHIQGSIGKKLEFSSAGFIGAEGADSIKQLRIFHDFFCTWKKDRKNEFTFIIDIGAEKNDPDHSRFWWGTALLYRHHFSERWKLGSKAEIFSDRDHVLFTTPSPRAKPISGFALNLDYLPCKWLIIRTEARFLYSGSAMANFNTQPVDHIANFLTCLAFYL